MKSLILSAIIAVTSLGCAPREAYVSPIGDFAKGVESLNASAEAMLISYTVERRGDLLRQAATGYIRLTRDPGPNQGKLFLPGEVELLCAPRDEQSNSVNYLQYLRSTSTSLSNIASQPSEDFNELLGALGTDYTIKVPDPNVGSIDTQCRDDLANYGETVYGDQDENLAVVEGITELYDIFKLVSLPALQTLDDTRRANALSEFLGDPDNREKIRISIETLEAALNQAARRERHLAAASFMYAHDDLKAKMLQSPPKSRAGCVNFMQSPRGTLESTFRSAFFRDCYRDTIGRANEEMKKVLTTAGAYDTAAGKTIPASAMLALRNAVDKLHDIANGEVDAEVSLAIAQALIRLHSAAKATTDQLADENNRKKAEAAMKKIAAVF